MKQQIVVIHGGTTFDTQEDYLNYLKTQEVSLERLRLLRSWKDSLQEKMGENFDILAPRMPNGTNARYDEWKIWFERLIPLFDENIVFIGHSLGGVFLAKYLSENLIPKKLKAVILVAAPFTDKGTGRSLADFKLPSSLEKFTEQGGQIYLFQSKDDPEVPFEQVEMYEKSLSSAKTMIFEDRGHFLQESFPEIIELIKKILEQR